MFRKAFVFFYRLLLMVLCLCSLPAAAQHYSFNTVSQDADAEFSSLLNCITDDSHGYLWIGTRSGLGRYDGHTLKKYQLNESDSLYLPSGDIMNIVEDNDKDLWILTNAGIAQYDYHSDRFRPLKDEKGTIVNAYAGCAWRKGLLLETGTELLYYNKVDKSFTPIATFNEMRWAEKMLLLDDRTLLLQSRSNAVLLVHLDSGNVDQSIFFNKIPASDLLLDSRQQVWITTLGDGLYCYTPDGVCLAHYTTANSQLASNRLQSITECQGLIYIGTKESGLQIFHPESGTMQHFRHEQGGGQFTLPGNVIHRLYTDRYDNVLMGITDCGLVNFNKVFLRSYSSLYAGFGKGPSHNTIACFCPQGDYIWIGTRDGGLNRFHPADNTFKSYPSTRGMFVFSIADFSPGKLLLSVLNKGMFIFDTATGQTTPFRLPSDQENDYIFTHGNGIYLHRNSPNTLLIIGRHVYIYHQDTGIFTQVTEEKENMIINGTLKMVCSEKRISYLSDRCHLYLLDHQSETLSILYGHKSEDEVINIATRTPDGLFWLGTNHGLIRYDAKERQATRIATRQFRDIMSLEADPLGRLWIGTYYALFSYNPAANRIVAYNKMDGAQRNEYIRASACLHDDHLYMGGVNGFVQISYKQAVANIGVPTFTISDCALNGLPEGNPFLDTDRTVELPYKSNFTISVMTEEKNRFRTRGYKFLVPSYSKEEIETSLPELRLYNLTPGKYTVQVSCSLSNGSWSPYQEIATFSVLPPWYLSFWFIGGNSLLLLALAAIGIWILLLRKQNLMERALEQNRLYLNEEKVKFLVNVSHELRTPLTLIYAPLNRMLQQTDHDDANHPLLQTACRQANRMTDIINMVLDLEKMEHKTVRLKMQAHPFNAWVEDCMKDFVSEGKERGIRVVFEGDKHIGTVDFDQRKCDIVLNNLLINALNHSPEGSTVTVRTQLDEVSGQARLSVSDEGPGIQSDELQELFTRFYQGAQEKTGSGLGLAYSKVLLEQHKGSIGAYNNSKKGATFYFMLPLHQSSGSTATVNEDVPPATEPANLPPVNAPAEQPTPPQLTATEDMPAGPAAEDTATAGYTLLAVDDQEDITRFIADALKDSFRQVLRAKDGIEALNSIRNNRPDVVISDVMMPRMDGYELCRQIKGDVTISHIPVVLLTAKTDEQSVMMGYKKGADAYIPKPFDIEMVKQVVFNLLNTRQRIQEKFAAPGAVPLPQEATISYADEAFLTKLNQLVEQHIANTDLDIALIEREMCMSRASLFSKMKVLTGMGCNEYITKMRMERATQLVRNSSLSFTEISERVGYSTASYFSSAFKQYTGMTPTQYRKKQAGPPPCE